MNRSASVDVVNCESVGLSQALRTINRLPRWLASGLGLWLVPTLASPGLAAERIIISYGPLQRSIPIEYIETYAQEGRIEGGLRTYTRYFDDAQLVQLRDILTNSIDLDVVAVSQFLYTEQGETLLQRLGEVIRTESNLSGFYAIRAALILAAAEPEGLTPLNVLKQFPLEGIRIDLARALQDLSSLETLIGQTQEAVAAIAQQSEVEASESIAELALLPDLEDPGPFAFRTETMQLVDGRRNRSFPADIYLPIQNSAAASTTPVIVISHGLGSDRSTFAYFARHLASYGFAVAVPEHPGSNAQQLQSLVSGRANQVTAPDEFINRPLDITYLLDQLERFARENPSQFGQLNLQQVGVMGQSFGGYTALALAGGGINFTQLSTDCPPIDSFNLSLLLQCRATELPQPTVDLKDDRVKAIVAVNPIGSSILGEADFQAIDIPVMLVTSTADTVSPALPEQIRPFTWLNSSDKYLLMLEGGTHFSTIDVPNPESEIVAIPPQVIGPDPALARSYLNVLGLAFFATYTQNRPEYRAYLNAGYVRSISRATLPLNLIRSLTPAQLAQALQEELPPTPDQAPAAPGETPDLQTEADLSQF
ncbi:alpha/beta hydrolase [Oculatella sp. LEGE 06141]|uniref:alpha/beta hydrolase n=1 Tax=Oculatella sp. LEGE 06141 TaxID=1828648 RepID=UPI001880ED5C|nr:alpha/beta hydrolase [Oculatella sp. LEGE 06141]MBE9177938.1 alpha/beta hydrolase [Oculatella sp. LEGE 06141]